MEKRKSNRRGKEVFLLGADKDGVLYWLESPSWDCDWYWGLGYIETYTNNEHPDRSRAITSLSHADNFMAKYFIEFNGSTPLLIDRTFTESEGWEICELFSQFYHLREQAEFWGRGKMNIARTNVENWKNKTLARTINKDMIPKITARILEILKPN